jgi:thiol:disulfide interchange protein DsbD
MTSRFGGGDGSFGGFSGFGEGATEGVRPLTVKLLAPAAPQVGQDFEIQVLLKHSEGYHTYAPGEKLGVPVEVIPLEAKGIEWGKPVFPPGNPKDFPMLGGKMLLFEGDVTVRIPGKVITPEGRKTAFSIKVSYAACTDTACLLPKKETLGGTWAAAGSASLGTTVASDPPATPEKVGQSQGGDFSRTLEDGLLWALLMSYLWGLAASISPCVYPMVPVTIAFFGSQTKEGSRFQTLLLAVTYVLGIVTTYAFVGLAAARVGRDLGSLLVHPAVVGLVSGLLFVMGLSLFGLFEMRLPRFLQDKLDKGEGKGYRGAFFTGAVMGLVAAPCVGPFASSILLFVARSGDMLTGFLSLGAFGLGIGTLFLFLALGISELPRSGMWMVKVKKVFGFVLIGASFYFLGPLLEGASRTLLWGVYLAIGADLGGAFDPVSCEGGKARRGAMLAALAAGLYLVVAAVSQWVPLHFAGGAGVAPGRVGQPAGETWEKSFVAAKERAQREGKPIFADFYADWCIPCKQMEGQVFSRSEVKELLAGFVTAKLDCTQPDSAAARFKIQELQVLSMPYLAVFDSQGVHHPELSHQGYLGVAEFQALLKKARKALS